MSTLDIITEIKNTASTNDKKTLLTSHKNDPVLKRVIKFALDSEYRSGIIKIPDASPNLDQSTTLSDALDVLENIIYPRKVTGNAARAMIADLLGSMSDDDQDVFIRVLTKKLDCGIQVKNANSVYGKNFIGDEPYMRCDLISKKTVRNITSFKTHGYAVSEIKYDGQFLNNIVLDNSVNHFSRNGIEYSFHNVHDEKFSKLREIAVRKFPEHFKDNIVVQGECLVLDEYGNVLPRTTGNGIVQKAGKGTITESQSLRVVFVLWDILPHEAYLNRHWPEVSRKERREILEDCLLELNDDSIRMAEYKIVHNIREALEYNAEVMERGEEGSILKCESGIWKAHTSPKQLKMKIWMEIDVQIVDIIEGEGKRKNKAGAISVQSSDGIITFNCGSGFKEKDNEWTTDTIWKNRDKLIGKIAAIKCSEITKDKKTELIKVFIPIFEEFRFDKDNADSYERILEIRESAVQVLLKSLLDELED